MSNTLALCIPAFNAEAYLPRLLESAKNQTKPFDEILVYDDCSADNTAELARSYEAEVITGEENQGPAVGRSRLAENAESDWLHFHDADDELYPNFVEQAQTWMSKEDPPDVVMCAYEYRHHESNDLISTRRFDAEALKEDPIAYAIRNQLVHSGLYQRKPFLRAGGPDTDPKVLYNEDPAMHCKLARAGLEFDADPTVTVINYKRPGSLSRSNRVGCSRSRYHVLEKCAKHHGNTHGRIISHQLWTNAARLAARGQWDLADKSVELAIQLDRRVPSHGGLLFRVLGAIEPRLALRIREYLIRTFKPHLRNSSA